MSVPVFFDGLVEIDVIDIGQGAEPGEHIAELFDFVLVVINSVNCDGNGLGVGDQKPMLIDVVDFVKCPERVIPSLVRFYRVGDECCSFGGDPIYFSIMAGAGYKLFPIPLKRELYPIPIATSISDDLIDNMVERRAKIVDYISNHESNITWDCFSNFQTESIKSGLSVFIDSNLVCIEVDPGLQERAKLIDVLLGPVNF